MRSALPKVLHPLCGRPLILWPVAAALEAGAGKVVVVDNPKRRLEDRLPEGVARRRPGASRTGPAERSPPPARTSTPSATVVVINGDVPLITAGGDRRRSSRPTRPAAPPRTMATMELDDPAQYGRVVRDAQGNVERVVEAKAGEGDATPEQLAIREVNTGVYAFDGGSLLAALEPARHRQRPGRAVPARRAAEAARGGQDDRRARGHRPHAHARRQRPRRARAASASSPSGASTSAHARNGVTIVDPDTTHIDVEVDDRPRHGGRAGHGRSRATRRSARTARSARSRRSSTPRSATASAIPHSYLVQARVDDFGTIGPFAYLRPDAHLHPNAKAGAFVEIKNSTIGTGHEGPAPVLHRGRRRRREHEHRRRQHHRQLRRAQQAPDDDRVQRAARAWTRRSSRRSKSATAPTPERVA